MKFYKFEDIIAWKKAKELSVLIYKIFRNNKDYSFRNQIQRASVFVMNNIAEEFERKSNNEFKQFLFIAKGSSGELRSMLHLAKELNYTSIDQYKSILDEVITISKLLSKLFKTLQTFYFTNFQLYKLLTYRKNSL